MPKDRAADANAAHAEAVYGHDEACVSESEVPVARQSRPTSTALPGAAAGPQLVWDLPLRVSHWGLVLTVTGSFVTHYIGSAAFTWHVWCGYSTLTLVAFRLAWGWIGPRYARFASFVRGPAAVIAHLRTVGGRGYRRSTGHSPLGAWMILLLLALLLAQALTGLFANDEVTSVGPLAGYVSHATSNRVSSWHEFLSDLILGAVALHVAAAVYYWVVLGDNLIGPLVTGYKHELPSGSGIGSQRLVAALVTLLGAAALLFWIVSRAPEPPDLLF
ncbi:MAG TPA: cytochrome b/b6 domain-containing protein [Steroidobacteraceae bacterium]|nr:cytochrome b/b6 domain-containing protein [Steroidobacteraceae bacterium]